MLEIQSKNAEVIAEGTLAAAEIVMRELKTFTGASSNLLKMNKADPKAAPEMAAAPLLDGPDEPDEPAPAFRSLGAASPDMKEPSFCSLGGGDEDGGSAAGDCGSAAGDYGSAAGDCESAAGDGGSAAGDCGDDGGGGGGGGTDEPEPSPQPRP